MNCGSVLEDSLIVSEVQFEEMGHGAAAIGQFVSAESSGGATNYGYGKFQVGSGTESREVTIKKAKRILRCSVSSCSWRNTTQTLH